MTLLIKSEEKHTTIYQNFEAQKEPFWTHHGSVTFTSDSDVTSGSLEMFTTDLDALTPNDTDSNSSRPMAVRSLNVLTGS